MKNHRTKDDHDDGIAAERNAQGAAILSNLRDAIHQSISGLKADLSEDEGYTKPIAGGVKVHLNEINKLLEAGNGESSENVVQANPGNGLDLDAARAEIRSRLVKLVSK